MQSQLMHRASTAGVASCSYTTGVAACRGRRSLRVHATTSYDPEGLFKTAPTPGLIAKRLANKASEGNKEFAQALKLAQDDMQREKMVRRESRVPPKEHTELIEFFLNTPAEDMEYQVARCRPQLSKEFFATLSKLIGSERFSAKPNQERLAELDTLRTYLEEGAQAVDMAIEKTTTAVERMKKLLSSKDKKAMILDMAAANEIDQGLIDLLQQNATAARLAGQEDAAKFIEKVSGAASKYLVTAA